MKIGTIDIRILKALESVLMDEGPDAVLAYGDTNSTLAAEKICFLIDEWSSR